MVRIREAARGRSRFMLLAAIPLSVAGLFGAAGLASASPPPNHMVTICHRTGAEAGGNTHDGYSIITVDVASILGAAGHDSHDQVGNGPIGDIIPAFSYDGVNYPGKNGGQAAIDNGCGRVS